MTSQRLVSAIYAGGMMTIAAVLAPPYLWTEHGGVQRAAFVLLGLGLGAIAWWCTAAVAWARWLVIVGLLGPVSRAAALVVEATNLQAGQRASGVVLYVVVAVAAAHVTAQISAARKHGL
jgi:hypothetical protein